MKKEGLDFPDIRNKLSPITTLISLLERTEIKDRYVRKAVKQSKISINYLANKEMYEEDEISND